MININGYRGSGKTTQLIKLANISYELGRNPIVIVPNLTMERFYKEKGLKDKIAVITPKFYLNYKEQFRDRDIFIDEAESVLKSIFSCGNLAVITSEKENTKEIKREDWDKPYFSKAEVIEAVKKLLKELEND